MGGAFGPSRGRLRTGAIAREANASTRMSSTNQVANGRCSAPSLLKRLDVGEVTLAASGRSEEKRTARTRFA